ncbi:MAG: hypothetical protein RL748_2878 [Pseudomonadota bacterium]|jgi:DNA-binding NarL/FixJ family response regulator
MLEKILVIDNDPYTIVGVRALLGTQFDIYAAFGKLDMHKQFKRHKFALTVLDLALHDATDGLDLIPDIQAQGSKILVLTINTHATIVRACIAAQTNGLLSKYENEKHLKRYVEGVLAGNHMIDMSLLTKLADPDDKPAKFGDRELELINWVFHKPAARNEDFAEWMFLADGSVKNMFQRIYKKLEVHSRIEMMEKLKQQRFRPRDPTMR